MFQPPEGDPRPLKIVSAYASLSAESVSCSQPTTHPAPVQPSPEAVHRTDSFPEFHLDISAQEASPQNSRGGPCESRGQPMQASESYATAERQETTLPLRKQ